MFVSTQAELEDFCRLAKQSKAIAVDTEFLREKTYYPKLCLVQVAAGDAIAAIDPIAIHDLAPLADLFRDPGIVKIFHACAQDLEVILDAMGCACAPVFDTQLAAAFLGMRQQSGYGALVERYTGVVLAKAEALTDWSRRPLDPEQLVYAEDDVRYLPGIYERMVAELERDGRLDWVRPEMERIANPAFLQRLPEDAYLRLRKSGNFTRRQLAIAREACAWREREAAAHDIPRRWVLSDEVMVEVCRRTPVTIDRLKRIRGTEQLALPAARGLCEAVRRGLDCPAEKCPKVEHRGRPSAETEGVLDLMYAVLRLISERTGVAPQLIATKDDLLDYALARKGALAEGWRHELAGKTLSELLDGKVGLTVRRGHIELLRS